MMTENQIMEFTNEQFGKIRTTLIDGEPWFVAKDAALALGYSKPLNAIERHIDEDDSLKRGLIDSVGRTQEAIFIKPPLTIKCYIYYDYERADIRKGLRYLDRRPSIFIMFFT